MPRNPNDFNKQQQIGELRQIEAEEMVHPATPLRAINAMLYEELYGQAPNNPQQELCGVQDATRQDIANQLGIPLDQVITEFSNRKISERARTAAREEEIRLQEAEQWGLAQRFMAGLQRKVENLIGAETTNAERLYFGQGDIWNKIGNIVTQMTGPLTAGVNMRMPMDAAGNFPVGAVNFANISNIPVVDPQNPTAPFIEFRQIDWCHMPLWQIREILQRCGQYQHFIAQQGYQNFETWRHRLDIIWYEIQGKTWEENIATTLTSKNRLAQVYQQNQYEIQTYLSPMMDTPQDYSDPATIALIARLQADSARAGHDPLNQDRLRRRRDRCRQELGQNRAEYIAQKELVNNLSVTITSLEGFNSSLEKRITDILQAARNVTGAHAVEKIGFDPRIAPPAPPTRFATLNDEITYFESDINRIKPLKEAAPDEVTRKRLNDTMNDSEKALNKAQTNQKAVDDSDAALRDQIREFMDIFLVHFRGALATPPFDPGSRLGQLQATLQPALAPGAPAGAFTALSTLIESVAPGNFIDDLRNQIFNVRGNIPDDQNLGRRIRMHIEDRRAEKERQDKVLATLSEGLSKSGTNSTPKEILIAYEKAALMDRGINEPQERALLAATAVEKQLQEIKKAQEFTPYINQELAEGMSRSVIGRLVNRINFLTYDEHQILDDLKHYGRTHKKILKNMEIDFDVNQMLEVVNDQKNDINYAQLPLVWESIYGIVRDKKIPGIDKKIEIEDRAWRPLQLFAERLQEIYLIKKKEDLAKKLTAADLPGATPAEKLINAMQLQDDDVKKTRETFAEDLKNLTDWLTQQGSSVYDWVFGKEGYRKRKTTELYQKAQKNELKDEEKGVLEKLGIDVSALKAGDLSALPAALLVSKELLDQAKKITNYLGLSGTDRGRKRLGKASSGVVYLGGKGRSAASWGWETGASALSGGVNLAKKTVKGSVAIGLLPLFPILHPRKTGRFIGQTLKFGLWTVPKEIIKTPFRIVKGLREAVAFA